MLRWSTRSFVPSKDSICGILNFVGRGKCSTSSLERGFRLLYQSIHGDWGSNFYSLFHVTELLLDVLESLLPRSFLFPLVTRGWLFASIVLVKHSLIATVFGGYVRIMPPGPTIFSSFVNILGGTEVLLLLLWNGITAFMVLLCILWALHLSGEFRQLP